MKIISTIFVFAMIARSVATAESVTVQSCDRLVEFENVPTRAVVNDVNMFEMMLALGLEKQLVGYTGVSGWKSLTPDLHDVAREIPELSPRYPNREILAGAGADFFFAGWNYGMKVGGEVTPESLARLGIQVYELTESCIHISERSGISLEDMYNDLLNIGKIFRIEARAESLVADYRSELTNYLSDLSPLASKPRVFVLDSNKDEPFTAGKYAIPSALIESAGGVNVMNDLEKSWATVGWESVVARDPDFIVIIEYGNVTAEERWDWLKSNPAYAGINAVRNNRYTVLEYNEATPGPRNIAAIKKLASAFRTDNAQ